MRVLTALVVGAMFTLVSCGGDDDALTLEGPDTSETSDTAADPTTTRETTRETSTTGERTTTSETSTQATRQATTSTTRRSGGAVGSDRANPVALSTAAAVGDGWSLRVDAYTPDATEAVLTENSFNEPPPAGQQFALIGVTASYAGSDAKATLFDLTFKTVGPSAVSYDNYECGPVPDELDASKEVFSGGSVSGNLCFVITPSDATGLILYATAGFTNDDVYFALEPGVGSTDVAPPSTVAAPTTGGPAGSSPVNPVAITQPAEVGEGWRLAVDAYTPDGTAAVLAENSFNEPPPEGQQYALVGITATYAGSEPKTTLFDLTIRAVGPSAVSYETFSCGFAIPGALDVSAEVFPGGSLSGNVCFSVAASDAAALVLYASAGFDNDDVYFALT